MEVKVSFDRDELIKWFDEDCEIDCEKCPLDEYMCNTLLEKAYKEYLKESTAGEAGRWEGSDSPFCPGGCVTYHGGKRTWFIHCQKPHESYGWRV